MSAYREELARLRIALRQAREKQSEMFDAGFEAATRMAEAGATPDRLREASGIPCVISRARTEPFNPIEEEDTLVDIPELP